MRNVVLYVRDAVSALHRGDSGQDLIEYALIAALIALGAIAGMGYVASLINVSFSNIGSILASAI